MKKLISTFLIAIFTIFVATGITTGITVQADTTTDAYIQQVYNIVNQERAANGLPALTLNTDLNYLANIRAQETIQSFSHTRPDGRSYYTVLSDYNVTTAANGENLAYGAMDAEKVMEMWMNSSGHRANILNSMYTDIGVACVKAPNGSYYWSQLFAKNPNSSNSSIPGNSTPTTTKATVVTTAPVETTKAPEVTTTVPEVTTKAPEVTTTVPEVTTKAPEVTTVPVETTAPAVTTNVTETTTKTPSVTLPDFSSSSCFKLPDFSSLSCFPLSNFLYSPVTTLGSSNSIGDINCDGKFNISDKITCSKYLTNVSQNCNISVGNADINYDGALNVQDVIKMCKNLA